MRLQKASTGLSQAAIAGASAAALAANLFRAQIPLQLPHHEQQHLQQQQQQQPPQELQQQQQQLPLVDLDLVLLLTPGLLLGVAVGAVLNDLLPEWFICAALVGVLLLSCHKTAVRGLLTWHAEAQAEASLAAAAAISSGPTPRLRPIYTGSQRSLNGGSSSPGSPCGSRLQRSGSSSPAGVLGCSTSRHSSSAFAQPSGVADLRMYSDSRVLAHGPAAAAVAGSKGQQAATAEQLEEVEGSRGSPAGGSAGSTPQPGTPQPPSSGVTLQQAVTVSTALAAAAEHGDALMHQQHQATAFSQGHIAAAVSGAAAAHLVQPEAATTAQGGDVCLSPPAAAAANDSDSSSSASYAELHQQRSLPIYQCETTPLPPTGQHSAAGGGTAAAAAAAGRPRGLARKGLYPGWFSPPNSEPGDASSAATATAGPSVEWRPCSRSSSIGTGVGYVIADNRLPLWRQQQQLSLLSHRRDSTTAAAAAAVAAVQLHLQQLWLWLPAVHLQQVPWMKLLSLAALWLGFMGLTALTGLLPLCSWSYVSYLLLFMGITGCVTATLIQVSIVQAIQAIQSQGRDGRVVDQGCWVVARGLSGWRQSRSGCACHALGMAWAASFVHRMTEAPDSNMLPHCVIVTALCSA